MAQVRLNKLLSQTGVASRRLADDLIRQGRVTLNGHVVTELGTKADPDHDDIRADGRRLKVGGERRYLLMYKPRGVVSTRSDPQKRRTVIDVLAARGIKGYFYPVGRLDYDSEGLLLITNDGDFAERVTHPRYELERTYEALVAGVPDDHDLDRLRRGVIIEGRRTLPARVRLVRVFESRDGAQGLLELTLREGRNRQVRYMCDAVGHPVDRLRRTQIGAISDHNMRAGDIRDLTPVEIAGLMGTGVVPAGSRPPARPEYRERREHREHGGPRSPRDSRAPRKDDRPRRDPRDTSSPKDVRGPQDTRGRSKAPRAIEPRSNPQPRDKGPFAPRSSGQRPAGARSGPRPGGSRPPGPRPSSRPRRSRG